MQKEGEKNITIEVTAIDHTITLSITDNGIGREKAKEKSEKKSFKKDSLGIQFAQERLNYFNKKYSTNYTFTISDVHDENNEAAGTRVVFDFSKN
jgi:sensor histidine kinase YesM